MRDSFFLSIQILGQIDISNVWLNSNFLEWGWIRNGRDQSISETVSEIVDSLIRSTMTEVDIYRWNEIASP